MAVTELDIWNLALGRVGESIIILDTFGDSAWNAFTTLSGADPAVAAQVSHPFSDGDRILIAGTQAIVDDVEGRTFRVLSVTANTYSLTGEDRTNKGSLGTGNAILLPDTKPVQVCFDAWTRIRDEVFRAHPWNDLVKRGRLARQEASVVVSSTTAANPIVCTTGAAHGYTNGDHILLESMEEMVELNDRYFSITVLTTTTFSIEEDGTLYTAESTGGTAKKALTPFKPDYDFDWRYALPSDSMRVLELLNSDELWTVEGEWLLTDENNGSTVPIRYIRNDLLTPGSWEPNLINALAARLAVEIARSLGQARSAVADLFGIYQDALAVAHKTDSLEDSDKQTAEDSWVTVRY